ncbi:unnamed protein product [Linum trigynum]|uniref:DUF4283 domain-containing protein n=1 Tax=Linum trigynum TaxID=586398 RepID=A0AAV2F7M4_9ROSI
MKAVADGSSPVAVGEGRSWASLFGAAEDNKLEYFEPELVNGSLRIPKSVMEEGAKQVEPTLVGQFLRAPPSIASIRSWANLLWVRDGEIRVSEFDDRLFLFQFPSEAVSRWVFEGGPWHYRNNMICLRKWVPGIQALTIDNSAVPIWVKLSGLPAELSSKEGLGRVASLIGSLLCMDQPTRFRQRVGIAKVCVELNAKKPQVNRISITPDGMDEMFIQVEYCHLPYLSIL